MIGKGSCGFGACSDLSRLSPSDFLAVKCEGSLITMVISVAMEAIVRDLSILKHCQIWLGLTCLTLLSSARVFYRECSFL